MTENQNETQTIISNKTLVLGIWTKPKQTFEYILKQNPNKFVILLIVLGGIVSAIDRASTKGMGDKMSTASVLLFALIGGALFGWITYYLYAFFMSFTGKWIKGKAEAPQFRTVIAWSLIPSVASLILLIPELLVFGDDLFKSELSSNELWYVLLYSFFGLVELVLGIWTLIILVKGVSIIQDFGIGKSILNVLFPGILLLGLVALIAIPIILLN